jgi:hypothetical protein
MRCISNCELIVAAICVVILSISASSRDYIIPEAKSRKSNGSESFGNVNTYTSFDSTSAAAVEDLLAGTVDLYSGQHTESFPLYSLIGRGGIEYNLSLNYSSNISQTAKSENYKHQASPFGLGFNIESNTIISSHNSTAFIDDDKYNLVIGGASIKLRHVENNRYITASGDPWIVIRHTHTIGDYEVVIGWTVKKDDVISHKGYQRWHRTLDDEIVEWLGAHNRATAHEFEDYLIQRYSQDDLIEIFPNGLEDM